MEHVYGSPFLWEMHSEAEATSWIGFSHAMRNELRRIEKMVCHAA
jgi:hypothetical protein